MDGAKKIVTPLNSVDKLSLADGSRPVDPTTYHRLVGSLQYLAITRPDVSFAVNTLSQFIHAPTQLHFQSLKHGGINDGGHSTIAYIIYLGSNIISWRFARQKSVSRSSTEAEYKALANAATEISWVKHLLHELGINLLQPPRLFCDNTGATYVCANPVYHSRMKHLAFDYHCNTPPENGSNVTLIASKHTQAEDFIHENGSTKFLNKTKELIGLKHNDL
ncbi:transposable element [Tanacetum coccineum]